jgi:hypothetical protein
VTRHVVVGFSEPANGNQAEAAAVSQAPATTGRAAATAAGHEARLALDAGNGMSDMPEWALSFWQWLQTASQGQASFVGTLMGSFFGLVALLLGALFNAWLNRRRDDRLRREDQQTVATALRAELEGLHRSLKENAETLRQEDYVKADQQITVPDLAQSIRIMPMVVSKLGLLDGKIIGAVITAYGVVEAYTAKVLLLGGRPGVTPDNFKRYVALPSDQVTRLVLLTDVTAEEIQKAIDQLGTIRKWREMSWPERWRWLRTTG